MDKNMVKDEQPAAQLEFDGIQGCKLWAAKICVPATRG
jgi:hypothetical protein